MRKSRFTDQQIVSALKEAALGVSVRDICLRTGISEPTFYGWRQKFHSLDDADVGLLRQLGRENQRLKRVMGHRLLELEAENVWLKQAVEKLSLSIQALKTDFISGKLHTSKDSGRSSRGLRVKNLYQAGREPAPPDERAGD